MKTYWQLNGRKILLWISLATLSFGLFNILNLIYNDHDGTYGKVEVFIRTGVLYIFVLAFFTFSGKSAFYKLRKEFKRPPLNYFCNKFKIQIQLKNESNKWKDTREFLTGKINGFNLEIFTAERNLDLLLFIKVSPKEITKDLRKNFAKEMEMYGALFNNNGIIIVNLSDKKTTDALLEERLNKIEPLLVALEKNGFASRES